MKKFILYPNYTPALDQNKFQKLYDILKICDSFVQNYKIDIYHTNMDINSYNYVICNYYDKIFEKWNLPIIILSRMDSGSLNRRNLNSLNNPLVKLICKEYVYTDKTLYNRTILDNRFHFEKIGELYNTSEFKQFTPKSTKVNDDSLDKIISLPWNLHQYSFINPTMTRLKTSKICEKPIDIFCIFHSHEKAHHLYLHRQKIKQLISTLADVFVIDMSYNVPKGEYLQKLQKSKICISPYGLGERIALDQFGLLSETIVIKPPMDSIITFPNIYTSEYMEFIKFDMSDMIEKVTYILTNYNKYKDIALQRKNKCIQFDDKYYAKLFINMLDEL